MIKLYGLRMSNYYSLYQGSTHRKGLEFEEIKAPPLAKGRLPRTKPHGENAIDRCRWRLLI